MNIEELIQLLEEARDEVGGDTEVRLAHQPNWPMMYNVGRVAVVDGDGEDSEPIIYIAEDSQLGYLSGEAATAVGWSS